MITFDVSVEIEEREVVHELIPFLGSSRGTKHNMDF